MAEIDPLFMKFLMLMISSSTRENTEEQSYRTLLCYDSKQLVSIVDKR